MMDTSVRGAYMLMLSHAHEHLGQSIAYARSNNITPPWTARQNAQIEKAKAKGKEKAMEASTEKKDEHAGHKH
jgi:beta-xylosidase